MKNTRKPTIISARYKARSFWGIVNSSSEKVGLIYRRKSRAAIKNPNANPTHAGIDITNK
jgi:hypothetical protein